MFAIMMVLVGCGETSPEQVDPVGCETDDTGEDTGRGDQPHGEYTETLYCQGHETYQTEFNYRIQPGDEVEIMAHYSASYMAWRETQGNPVEEWVDGSTVNGAVEINEDGSVTVTCTYDGAEFEAYVQDQFELTATW